MRIDELTSNLPITFFVTIGDEHLTLESKIAEVYPQKRLVLAQAIYHNDKIVTFRESSISVDMLVTTGDDKPQLFKNVTVTLVKKRDGTLCYNLACTTESKTYNRRESFRCFVGIPTVLLCGASKVSHVAMIRDVSITGFSVVCDEEISVNQGQVMRVALKDYFEETDEKFMFQLYGLVVRMVELPNGSTLYGCRLNHPVQGLDAYIMKKERLRLKKTNGGNL